MASPLNREPPSNMSESDAITESNFATSSLRAAVNIVLTVSTICLWPAVRRFCWAPAVETFAEQVSAKATVAKVNRNRNDMDGSLVLFIRIDTSAFYLFPVGFDKPPLTPLCRTHRHFLSLFDLLAICSPSPSLVPRAFRIIPVSRALRGGTIGPEVQLTAAPGSEDF